MAVVPVLDLMGAEDECVPENVDKREQLKRLCQGMGGTATCALVHGATHVFQGAEGAVAESIVAFIRAGFDLQAHPLEVKGVEVVCGGQGSK